MRVPRTITIGLVAFLCCFGIYSTAVAERYLTADQVRKVCFPEGESFEDRTIRFSKADIQSIERRSGLKVKNLGNKISVVRTGGELIGVIVIDHVLGKHEIIDYAVAISPEGKVLQVEIMEYRESHGGQIRSAKWREQFKGKASSDRFKLNDDIYNISGATMSCRHVSDGIKRVLATFDLVIRPLLPARVSERQAAQQ